MAGSLCVCYLNILRDLVAGSLCVNYLNIFRDPVAESLSSHCVKYRTLCRHEIRVCHLGANSHLTDLICSRKPA